MSLRGHEAYEPSIDSSIAKGVRLRQAYVGRAFAFTLRSILLVAFFFVPIITTSASLHALEPNQILVVVNLNVAESLRIAGAYMGKRAIPDGNLLALRLTDKEICSRKEYDQKVALPVRDYLRDKDPAHRIRCVVTVYGMPLKVRPPEMSDSDRSQLSALKDKERALMDLRDNQRGEETQRAKAIDQEIKALRKDMGLLRKADQGAALDSELALVLWKGYALSGWVPNPYFVGFRDRRLREKREETLMVSRLDGPSESDVLRMIDESLEAERSGLKGTAYFDARWPKPPLGEGKEPLKGYAFYDRSIHLAAEAVRKSGRLRVVVNDKTALFQAGDCPDAALYCGWYSLAHYVDAFTWKPGSLGYHIASAECRTLKKKGSQVWCKRMIEEGVSATLGPVAEPYVEAFPVPEVFFGLLVDGRFPLVECYAASTPFLSWQMVLLGDPLYRPFRN
jgi:uncharacterized protein (TIGR03790 family)